MVILYTPEETGIQIAFRIITDFIALLVGDTGLGRIYDDLIVGLFNAFMDFAFDLDNLTLMFSLFLALILMGLFIKYIWR